MCPPAVFEEEPETPVLADHTGRLRLQRWLFDPSLDGEHRPDFLPMDEVVGTRLWPKKVHDCEACLSGQASKEQR